MNVCDCSGMIAIDDSDSQNLTILFEVELYYNFVPISNDDEHRIVILPHQSASFCFLFTKESDGQDFYRKVFFFKDLIICSKQLMNASEKYRNDEIIKEEKKKKKKKKGGFFSFFKKVFFLNRINNEQSKKEVKAPVIISGPSHVCLIDRTLCDAVLVQKNQAYR